jgi:BirA family biotin operon repressor/biotin-[acetyl-CoA-carboxylase] ligase
VPADVAERVRARLRELGCEWTAPVEHHLEIGSTNDRARELAAAGASEWTAVLADAQTAGRGRQGRRWHSAPGDLFLSLVLRPAFGPERAMLIPMTGSLAVADALQALGVATHIKWPNDVLAGEAKIAGLLAEGLSGPRGLDAVVLGIGVNLTLDPATLSPELGAAPTSVSALRGHAPAPAEAAAQVLARMAVWYDSLAREGPPAVLAAWRARAVPWWGRAVEVVAAGQPVRGIARGVDERGALLIEQPDGALVAVLAGDARALRPRKRGRGPDP